MSPPANNDGIPQFVKDDISGNPDLVQRWMDDAEFREAILHAEDPQQFAAGNQINISQDTSDWIKERVKARGIDRLLGKDPGHIIAF